MGIISFFNFFGIPSLTLGNYDPVTFTIGIILLINLIIDLFLLNNKRKSPNSIDRNLCRIKSVFGFLGFFTVISGLYFLIIGIKMQPAYNASVEGGRENNGSWFIRNFGVKYRTDFFALLSLIIFLIYSQYGFKSSDFSIFLFLMILLSLALWLIFTSSMIREGTNKKEPRKEAIFKYSTLFYIIIILDILISSIISIYFFTLFFDISNAGYHEPGSFTGGIIFLINLIIDLFLLNNKRKTEHSINRNLCRIKSIFGFLGSITVISGLYFLIISIKRQPACDASMEEGRENNDSWIIRNLGMDYQTGFFILLSLISFLIYSSNGDNVGILLLRMFLLSLVLGLIFTYSMIREGTNKTELEKELILPDDLKYRVKAISARAVNLQYFKTQALLLFTNLKEKLSNVNETSIEITIQDTESVITQLESCERKIIEWDRQGYDTTPLATLHDRSISEILEIVGKYEENVYRVQAVRNRIGTIESSYPEFGKDPDANARLTAVKQALSKIDNLEAAESGLREVESQLENFRRSQNQKIEWIRHIKDQSYAILKEMKYPENIRQEMNAVLKLLNVGNPAVAEESLKKILLDYISSIDFELAQMKQQRAVCSITTEYPHILIDKGQYADAMAEAEKVKEKFTTFCTTFTKAKEIMTTGKSPEILTQFSTGNYEAVIRSYKEQQNISEQVIEFQNKAKEQLTKASKVGSVPESIVRKVASSDIPTLQTAIHNIEDFITSATPQLSLTLEKTQFAAGEWHSSPIHIANTGSAHAIDVTFTFTDEFETRWIESSNIEAGASTDITIGLRPKQKGKIPLEIHVKYRDSRGKEYTQPFKYWVEVLDTAHGTLPPSPIIQKPGHPPQDLSNRFTDWEFIGKGGFAQVFKAKRRDGQYVAVKIPISLDESTGRSFIAEMQSWTKLSHINIVKLYDFNIMPCPYFEMELCDSSLADRKKPIECEAAAWIIFNVCEGLKFTHSNKIIHRDLKPQNILLKNEVPKISDWGLSRIISESTSTTSTSFTPYYAAPEQISSEHKDERTDIWQLGVIFYELVTGLLPFTGDSYTAVMRAIETKNPTLPSAINPSLHDVEAVIMKCLEKNPSKRYQSVIEMQKDLALYLRITYTESLKISVTANDLRRSAFYCGKVVKMSLSTGDMKAAHMYLLDLVHYSKGDVKVEAQELAKQLKVRIDRGIDEIPDELIDKADIIVHKVNLGSGKM
jgi:tetratricopeptide (TPR) repeat protein